MTPKKGVTDASKFVVWPATIPAIVGAAGSTSITVVVLSTVGVPKALLKSLSAKVVVVTPPRGLLAGVNIRASSSAVIAAAVPVSA